MSKERRVSGLLSSGWGYGGMGVMAPCIATTFKPRTVCLFHSCADGNSVKKSRSQHEISKITSSTRPPDGRQPETLENHSRGLRDRSGGGNGISGRIGSQGQARRSPRCHRERRRRGQGSLGAEIE